MATHIGLSHSRAHKCPHQAMLVAADGTLIRKLSRSEAVEFGRREALKLKVCSLEFVYACITCV
eukprot:1249083-Amorphochlora_amoeboformis.AAC.1